MNSITITDFQHWRDVAREAVTSNVVPHDVDLKENDGQATLFGNSNDEAESLFKRTGETPKQSIDAATTRTFNVDRNFISLAETVGYHRDPSRWNLLYRILWRIAGNEPHLLQITTDDDVLRLHKMEKEVRRDAHKMKAFVRFRKIIRDGDEYFIAWHRPDHRIVRKVAPFFSRRFKGMNWTILTPDESVVWDQKSLNYGDGVPRSAAPDFDELEELWKTYYANIFNPARVKIKMMKSEMPVRHWPTLPEAEIIADLLTAAPTRVEEMIERHEGFAETALAVIDQLPPATTLGQLAETAKSCTACDLYCDATQVVFGHGPANAPIVLVGEQPGDQEDLAGQPFVGPAGKILDEALIAAGIERESIYVTNIVKHFKHKPTQTPQGKKRLHQRPNAREIRCCRPWFDAEWSLLTDAKVLVCLGATAASAIIGPEFRITKGRGRAVATDYCEDTIATWHPSAILRTPDQENKTQKFQQLVSDLVLGRAVESEGQAK